MNESVEMMLANGTLVTVSGSSKGGSKKPVRIWLDNGPSTLADGYQKFKVKSGRVGKLLLGLQAARSGRQMAKVIERTRIL